MYQNETLKDLTIMNQSYFRSESKITEPEIIPSKLPGGGSKGITKENRTLERLSLNLGIMKTVKPLIRCFITFTRLRVFAL